jgi:PHS family inorganic phosphate transporter-like MFS transporter
MLTGIFSSFLIPETKGKSLEELSGELPPREIAENEQVKGTY